jgi:hypothetical protein
MQTKVFVVAALIVGGCSASDPQVEACESTLTDSPALLLVGEEGTRWLCRCTVDSLAVRFPDAADRWESYAVEFDQRLTARGIVGMALDTTYASTKSMEIAEFAAAHSEIVAGCTQSMLKEWAR